MLIGVAAQEVFYIRALIENQKSRFVNTFTLLLPTENTTRLDHWNRMLFLPRALSLCVHCRVRVMHVCRDG